MTRHVTRHLTFAFCLVFSCAVQAQETTVILPPQPNMAFHGDGCGPDCYQKPYDFLWTGYDAVHEYDVYGHRRMAVRTEPKSGIQVEGLLNRRYRGCPNCIPDPCGCNSRCTTSLVDAISYMRSNNCASCGPQCHCPSCRPVKTNGPVPAVKSAQPTKPAPAADSKPTSQAPPRNIRTAPIPRHNQPPTSAPAEVVQGEPEPQAVVTPQPVPESTSEVSDEAALADPPEPRSDVLNVAPSLTIPPNEIPQNVIPLRSSRRPKRDRTLSAIRRYIRA